MQCLQSPEEGIRSPGTGVRDSCELPCGCWESNTSPLEEISVLLIIEPSPQSPLLSLLLHFVPLALVSIPSTLDTFLLPPTPPVPICLAPGFCLSVHLGSHKSSLKALIRFKGVPAV